MYGLRTDEFNRISSFTISKRIRDMPVNVYNGTTKVRMFGIARPYTEYEAFKMKDSESL